MFGFSSSGFQPERHERFLKAASWLYITQYSVLFYPVYDTNKIHARGRILRDEMIPVKLPRSLFGLKHTFGLIVRYYDSHRA